MVCLVVALLLFFVCFGWVVGCVVGGSFSLRMIATKRKGKLLGLVLSSWVVVYVMRLLIVRGLPAIPFPLLRGSVRKCSNVGGLRHNIGNQSR